MKRSGCTSKKKVVSASGTLRTVFPNTDIRLGFDKLKKTRFHLTLRSQHTAECDGGALQRVRQHHLFIPNTDYISLQDKKIRGNIPTLSTLFQLPRGKTTILWERLVASTIYKCGTVVHSHAPYIRSHRGT